MRPPEARIFEHEMVVDNFAGGGGASTGIAWAIGRSPDIAINHNAEALAMHRANHPTTKHLREDVRDVDPDEVCRGRRVALAWFSPDCTHFSKAKGGRPDRDPDVAKRSRGLAWVAVKWAKSKARPTLMFLENVEEFQTWEEFEPWAADLKSCGYAMECREIRASKVKAPTSRKRLVIILRCDGRPIRWPEQWHVDELQAERQDDYARTTAADCIDFSLPMPSIFLAPAEARAWGQAHGVAAPKRPLAEPTLRRIARGVWRFVIKSADPFIINVRHTGYERDVRMYSLHEPMRTIPASDREFALVAPALIKYHGFKRAHEEVRGQMVLDPIATLDTSNRFGLIAAYLAKHNGGHEATGQRLNRPRDTITTIDQKALVTGHLLKLYGTSQHGADVREPMPAILTGGNRGGGHIAAVSAFLVKYYGTKRDGCEMQLPLDAITTRDRFGLVTVSIAGEPYAIADIGMRMLTPRELFLAQGFPADYEIDTGIRHDGQHIRFTKKAQTRLVGNSVPPHMAAAVVRANLYADGDAPNPTPEPSTWGLL